MTWFFLKKKQAQSMEILVFFIENTFQVLSVICGDCKGFKKNATYCLWL